MADKTLNLDEIVNSIQNSNPSDYIKKNPEDAYINQYLGSPHFTTENDPLAKAPVAGELDPFWENEFKAINQTMAEDWANGLTKFAGKVAINTVGNLAGLLYGLPSAIAKGELRQSYDNEFMHMLDNMDESLSKALPNYVTQEESEYSIFRAMGTRAFLLNDVMGGLAFTTSAVLSEVLASGITTMTLGGGAGIQAGLTARLLSKAAKATKALTKTSKIADIPLSGLGSAAGLENAINQSLKFGRQFITGAGYEAGVEARHFVNEAKEAYILDYVGKYGKEPSAEQIADRMSDIHDTANAVFAGNLILVGGTNMLTLPKTFGIGSTNAAMEIQKRGLRNYFSPKAAIQDLEKKASKWSLAYDNWNKLAKVGYYTGAIAKRPIAEGIIEEGGQGLMKRAGLDYMAKKYSADGAVNAYTLWDSLMDAFDETYGDSSNKEFKKEVAIGMIIGLIGAPGMQKGNIWQGSALNTYRETKRQLETAQEYIDKLNTNDITPFLKTSLANHFSAYETNKEIDEGLNSGDAFRVKNAENAQLFSSIKSRYDMGMIETIKEDIVQSFDELTPEAFATTFNYDNLTTEELVQRKDKVKRQMLDKVDSVKESIEQAKKIVRGRALKGETEFMDSRDLEEALAYNIESVKNLDKRESEMASQLAQNLGTDINTVLEAAKLGSRTKFSQTWINKYQTAKKELEKAQKDKEINLSKLTQGSAIKRNEKQLSIIERDIAKLDTKIQKQNQKIFEMIGDKFNAEKTKLAAEYLGDNYNYNIDDFKKAVDAVEEVHKKYNEKYKTNPELSEESLNLHTDLKKVAEQRMNFTQEIQALMSREGARVFKDDLQQIKDDSFKIAKDDLIGRYRRSIVRDSLERGDTETAQALIEENEQNVTTSEDISKIKDLNNEAFNQLKQKAIEAESEYEQAIKNLNNASTLKTKLKNIINGIEVAKEDETSQDNLDAMNSLISTINNRIDIINAVIEDFKQARKEGDEKILNSVNSLIRVVTDPAREKEVIAHLKTRNSKFLYDFLTIKKEPYERAGEIVNPRNSKGEEIEGPISIQLGNGKDSGYQLYDGDFLIGGITRPDKYLYDGMPLDITSDEQIKALGIDDVNAFRIYYIKAKEVFDKVDKGEEVSGKELGKVIRFRYQPDSFEYVPNDEQRILVSDFVKNTDNHITVGNKSGLLVKRGTKFYLYNEEDGIEDVTRQVGHINSALKTETLSKIRAQYIAIIPGNTDNYMPIALDYPVSSEYDTESMTAEIDAAHKELENLSREELDKERASGRLVYRPLDMFITLKNKFAKTSNLHVDARIQRSYNKKKDEYSKPYLTIKVSGNWYNAPSEYIDKFLTEKDGEYFISTFVHHTDDKPTRIPLTKSVFLKAFNDRLYNKRKGDLGKLLTDSKGSMAVEAVNIKKRIEVNESDLGSLELAVRPITGEKPYFIQPNKKIFEDKSTKEKIKKVISTAKVDKAINVENYSVDFERGNATLDKYPYGTYINGGMPIVTKVARRGKPFQAVAQDEEDIRFSINMNLQNGHDPFADRERRPGVWYFARDFDTLYSLGYRVTEQGAVIGPDGKAFTDYDNKVIELDSLKKYYRPESSEDTKVQDVAEEAESKPEVVNLEQENLQTPPTEESIDDLFNELDNRDNVEEDSDEDFALSTLRDDSFPISSLREAEEILSKIIPIKSETNPDGIFTIKEISEFKESLRANNIPFGAFYQSVIYLDQNRATKGTTYHEAFHGVYRVLTTESERNKILKEAKKKYAPPTKSDIEALKSVPAYAGKSDNYLVDLYYEEKMADDFADKANKSPKTWLGKLFEKISNWVKSLRGVERDSLTVYFDNILQGQYKNADVLEQGNDVAFSFFKILPRKKKEGITIPPRTSLTENETSRLISRTASQVLEFRGRGESLASAINKSIEHLQEFYSYNTWKPVLTALPNKQAAHNAVAMLTDINNALKGKENLNKLRREVAKMVRTLDADLYNEQEDADTPESYQDNYVGENNGFKTLSQEIKAFLMTLEYPGDEFNLGLTQEWMEDNKIFMPVNVYKAYFNIQKALTDVKPVQMLNRLKYLAKKDSEMSAVYDGVVDKIKKETNIDKPISEYSIKELEKSNFFNAFVTNFQRTRLDIRNVLYNPANGEFRIISANQKDAAKTQVTQWYEIYQSNLNNTTNSEIADNLKVLRNIYYPSQDVEIGTMVANIDKIINSVKTTLRNSVGMDLSEDYIKWSWVHDNLEDLENHYAYLKELERVSPVEQTIKEMLEFHDSFDSDINSLDEKIQYKNTGETLGTTFDLLPSEQILASALVNNRNPYGVNQVDVDESTNSIVSSGGARTRLFNIAAANAIFDPTVRPTSYQNIEGKNIWDVVNRSFYFDMYSLFKTAEFKEYASNVNENTWEDLDYVLKENDMFYPSHLVKLYHQSNLNNPLLSSVDVNELFSQDKLLSSIGGIRETTFREDGKIDIKKDFVDGKTWKHMDFKSKLVASMSYYAQLEENDFTRYNWNVNEGKSTTLLATLPKYNVVTDSKLSNTAISHLTKLFKGEFDKISFESKLIGKNEGFKVEGYNYDMKDGSNSYKDNPNLRAFKFNTFAFLEELDNETFNSLLSQAREGKELTEDELFTILEPLFQAHFLNIKDEMIETLSSQDFRMVIPLEDGEYRVEGLPKYFKDGNRLNEDRILEFIVNDYINSVSLNSLMDIDSFFGKKDFTDFVKRNAGKIAYGPSLGSGQTKIAIINNSGNELLEGVDDTDAQSYSTESWEYNIYLKSLGKLPNKKVKEALRKKRKGYKLDEKELDTLKFYKAMGQSKKLVSYDHMIYMKTSVMSLQRSAVSYLEKKDRVVVDSLYDRLFEIEDKGGSREEIQNLTNSINSYWKAIPGRESLHNLLNSMEAKGIGIVSFDSAIKGSKVNVSKVNSDGSVSLNPVTMNNKFLREQVATDGFKKSIAHGTQLMQLIWSEQSDSTKVDYRGREFELGTLRSLYKSLLSERIKSGRINLEGTIFEKAKDGKLTKPVYKELYKSFKSSLESSSPNPYLQELFATDINGNPEYDPNFTGVSAKFFQMFMAYASADVMKHKTKGAKYTLASDFGYEILVDQNDNVIKWSDYKNNDGTIRKRVTDNASGTRKLKYENGVSEAIISSNIANLYNLKPGEDIPSYVAKQIGFRIPTQDKHSMIRLKVVDVLPAETMNTIIVHPKVIELSGADFDIDSLFARMKDTYKGKEYGNYLTTENITDAILEIRNSKAINKKLDLFLQDTRFKPAVQIMEEFSLEEMDSKVNAEIVKDEIKKEYDAAKEQFYTQEGLFLTPEVLQSRNPELYRTINDNINAYKKGELSVIKPLTTEEINNMLFDIEYELIHNEGNKEIAETPASFKSIEKTLEIWKENGLDYAESSNRSHDIMTRIKSIKANDAGNAGIGPAALANIATQNLIDYNAQLFNKILGKNKFTYLTEKGNRVNDLISTVISAMTDNAKHLYSALFNMNVNTVSFATTMFGLGFDSLFTYSMMRSKSFEIYSSMLERVNSPLTSRRDRGYLKNHLRKSEKLVSYVLSSMGNFDINSLLSNKIKLTESNLIKALKYEKGLKTDLSEEDYFAIQAKIISNVVFPIKEVNTEMRAYTKVLSLIKGFKANPARINSIFEDLASLGVKVEYDKNNVEIKSVKKSKIKLDWFNVITSNPYVKENVKTAGKIKAYLGDFLIAFSKVGEDIIKTATIQASNNRFDNDEKMMSMIRDFSSYVMLKKYKADKSKEYTPLDLFDRSLIDEHRELLKEVNDPTSPLYNNIFLTSLSSNAKGVNAAKIYELIMNTRSLRSKDITSNLMDSFRVLVAYDKYKPFAVKLMEHLIMKDALVYRNNSYLSSIDPHILRNVIKPLSELVKVFSEEDMDSLKKLLKTDVESLKKEFSELYLLDSANFKERRSTDTGYLIFSRTKALEIISPRVGGEAANKEGYDPIRITYEGSENGKGPKKPVKITFNGRAGTDPDVFKTSDKEAIKNEREYIEKLHEALGMSNAASASSFNNKNGTLVQALGFPLGFQLSYKIGKNKQGEDMFESKYMVLKRISRNPYKQEWEEPTMFSNRHLVPALEAEFEVLEGSNYGLFSTMAYSSDMLKESYKAIEELRSTKIKESSATATESEQKSFEKAVEEYNEEVRKQLKARVIKKYGSVEAWEKSREEKIEKAEKKGKRMVRTMALPNIEDLEKDKECNQ